jgi:hypothetical protein
VEAESEADAARFGSAIAERVRAVLG